LTDTEAELPVSPTQQTAKKPRPHILFGQELTLREREVVAQVLRGVSNLEVGAALFIEEKTVKFHLGRIFKKIGVKTRGQLILKVLEGTIR
jgi:DNA-binding CsgD family transcriptional regulator